MRAGDWFSAGGWSGAVRSLQHSIPPVDLKSSPKSSNKGSKGKGKDKGNAETSNLAAVFPQIPLKDSTVASAGMAATLLVTLHQDGNDPRPIGDTVRFHRDASVIKKERKRRSQSNAAAAPSDLSTEQQEDQPISTAHSNTDTSRVLARSSPLSSHMQIEKKVKEVPAEVFATGKEAAEYCMGRNQLEVKLAAYAISPQDATRFRLERLSTLFQKQKPGFRGAISMHGLINSSMVIPFLLSFCSNFQQKHRAPTG